MDQDDAMKDFIEYDEDEKTDLERKKRRIAEKDLGDTITAQALDDAYDIFGRNDEIRESVKKRQQTTIAIESKLFEKTNPSNDKFLETDIPERLQSYVSSSLGSWEDQLVESSKWIADELNKANQAKSDGEKARLVDVENCLKFIHRDMFDVPYISSNLKESCPSLFPPNKTHHLWAVIDFHKQWQKIQNRKKAIRSAYEAVLDSRHLELMDDVKLMEDAKSLKEVEDVQTKLKLHFGVPGGTYKLPSSRNNVKSNNVGVQNLAKMFGTLRNLSVKMVHQAGISIEEPEVEAKRYSFDKYTPRLILEDARLMVAHEISCEPLIKKRFRSIFLEHAFVSTSPTIKGIMKITSDHDFAKINWLKDKPVKKFDDAQWLVIEKSEKEKLINVEFNLRSSQLDKLIKNANAMYLKGGQNQNAELWDEQRKQIITHAFKNIMFPLMVLEAKEKMLNCAKKWLFADFRRRLKLKLSVASFWGRKIVACCSSDEKIAFVSLDSAGELRGHLCASFPMKEEENHKSAHFLEEHNPDVVVLGAANFPSLRLKDDVTKIMKKTNPPHILYCDETLPKIYENSHISEEQFPLKNGMVKRAIALGRYLQNPIAMVATLCGPNKDILRWKQCPMLAYLPDIDELFDIVEQVMVDAASQAEMNVNYASQHSWLFASLQFISGLGPAKAGRLQKEIEDFVKSGSQEIKSLLEIQNHGLQEKVLLNASAFLTFLDSSTQIVSLKKPIIYEELQIIYGDTFKKSTDIKVIFDGLTIDNKEKGNCVHESGVKGVIDLKDHQSPNNIKKGDELTGTIVDCQKTKYILILRYKSHKPLLSYYLEDHDNTKGQKEAACAPKKGAKDIIERRFSHPFFHNITVDSAIQSLSSEKIENGKYLVCVGIEDRLILVIKLFNGVYFQKEIIELGYSRNSKTFLGGKLRMGEVDYEDLDEVVCHYVDPLVDNMKQVLACDKFRDWGKVEVEEQLRAENCENSMPTVTLSHEIPGDIFISYIMNSTIYHKVIKLSSRGFKYLDELHKDFHLLVEKIHSHHKNGGTHSNNPGSSYQNQKKESGQSSYSRPQPYNSRDGGRGHGLDHGRYHYHTH